jgi:hypothetical protein
MQSPQAGSHDPWSAEISDYVSWIITLHHGKPPNVVVQHLVRSIVQGFIRIGHN